MTVIGGILLSHFRSACRIITTTCRARSPTVRGLPPDNITDNTATYAPAPSHSAPGSDTAFSAEKRRLHYQAVADTKLGDDARWTRRVDLELFSQAGDVYTQFLRIFEVGTPDLRHDFGLRHYPITSPC